MKHRYIATDLELESKEDLDVIVKEFGEEFFAYQNEKIEDIYFVGLSGVMNSIKPEQTVEKYCNIIEKFPKTLQNLWKTCGKKVLDIGFECRDDIQHVEKIEIPSELIKRVSNLDLRIIITIYPN